MSRGCGSCNLCCKLLHVPDIGKPAQMACWWTTVHGGCARHGEKPDPKQVAYDPETKEYTLLPANEGKDINLLACATFKCLWLESQDLEPELQLSRVLRPDMTHVVLGPQDPEDETLLYVQVDPSHPTAWRDSAISGYLNGIIARGGRLEIICGDTRLEVSEPF